ncbi:MAG: hypothetical protein KIT39_09530 [Nitrospirales bacterium]|nr:hypothetical protein [Nitrospirales bacterium]
METQKALSKIHLDSNLSKEQRTERAESLRNAFLNQPYMAYSTILKAHDEKGREIYHYFPRIQIDFSADLLSNSNLDRFSQLAMLILIPEADFKEGVRFLDFSPKGANILEFTRGQVQQQSQLIAKASAEAAEPISKSVNLGGELSYTATETFTRDLKDAIEQRTAGVIGNGRGFLVQLRAIKQLRIGGTYSFDVSIEVPSKPVDIPKEKKYEAVPVLKKDPQNKRKLVPNIILVSMVRHVHDRGMTGWFNRVPETENDDVYDQVILKEVNNLPIWEFNDTPWIRPDPIKINTFTAKVITNRKDARFAIFDKNNNILAHGEGENAEISIANDKGQLTNARLIFFPVAYTPTQGNPSNLMPSPTEILISETSGEDISRTFATTYTAP